MSLSLGIDSALVCAIIFVCDFTIVSSLPCHDKVLFDVHDCLCHLVCSLKGGDSLREHNLVLVILAKHNVLEIEDRVYGLGKKTD